MRCHISSPQHSGRCALLGVPGVGLCGQPRAAPGGQCTDLRGGRPTTGPPRHRRVRGKHDHGEAVPRLGGCRRQESWVAGVGPGLQRYDAMTGAPTGEVAISSVCSAMDQGFESIWAVSCDENSPTLVRIDARTGASTARIPAPARLAAESSVGAGEGAVWILTSGNPSQLIAVDPNTNTVARTIPAPTGAVAVRAGLGSVWVSLGTPGQVARLDPASGQVLATVGVGRGASFLALGPDAVWVINAADGTVSRVDPATNTVTSTIRVSSGKVSGGDIAATANAVWVRVTEDALAVRIDPRTNAVVERLGPSAGSGGVAIADTSVWITAHDTLSIWRVPQS